MSSPREEPPFARAAFFMWGAIVVWATHFGVLYGTTGLVCARGWSEGATLAVIGAATLVAAGITLIMLVAAMRRRATFEGAMGTGTAALALVAIVFEGGAALLVPVCA